MAVTFMRLGFICLSMLAAGCVEEQTPRFELHGTIIGETPKYVFINYGTKKDSSLVINNKFVFTGVVNSPIRAEVYMRPASTMNKFLYLENTKIEINLSVTGKMHNGIRVKYISLDTIIGSKTALLQSDFEMYKKVHESDKDWKNKLHLKLKKIITSHPSHSFSGDLLAEVGKMSVLENNQMLSLYTMLNLESQSAYSKESIRKIIFPEAKLSIGTNMLDFTLPNAQGVLVNTEKYRGSMLLIDFWASWCVPCRRQNPELLKLYVTHKNKGFAILGVSIDSDKDKWLTAIKKDKISWENVIDSRGLESDLLIKYDATSAIPVNYLVNKKGIIIKKNLSMSELEAFLN